MKRFKIVYTDPAWAVDRSTNPAGEINHALASIEREILGDKAELNLGIWKNGGFVTEGPEFDALIAGADALVVYRTKIGANNMATLLPSVRAICRQGVGFDNLDVPLLEASKIIAFNIPDYCVDEASTHAVTLWLASERHLCVQNDRLKAGHFNIFAGGTPRRLQDLRVGILGYGRIGRATSRKLQAFVGSVVAYDPYVSADLMRGYGVRKIDSLEKFTSSCDAIFVHSVLDASTENFVNEKFLAKIKPGAMLVNAARGKLVHSEAVYHALKSGKLAGFASDVFSPEDPNQDPWNKKLLAMNNVVVTSHRAFLSIEAEKSQRERAARDILSVLTIGKPPSAGHLTTKLDQIRPDQP